LPHRAAGKVIYTGTHDNDTTLGWFASGAADHERRNAECYLGRSEDGIHWAFIRAAQNSVADFALIPMQDALGLGSEARMNTPSLDDGNWSWRLAPRQFTAELSAKLAQLAEVTDRLPQPFPVPPQENFAA
jgi:4-alpha-glucanotransferase